MRGESLPLASALPSVILSEAEGSRASLPLPLLLGAPPLKPQGFSPKTRRLENLNTSWARQGKVLNGRKIFTKLSYKF